MKLNKLTLSNIGAYYGHYEFDLQVTDKSKNIILFGGRNGAGKTTLLDSLRIVLFGPFAYGYRAENETYFKKIKSLFNKTALSNAEKKFQINIEFEYVENLKRNTYLFNRRWEVENNRVKEIFSVLRNGQYLDDHESEIFHSKIREEIPPKLLDFFLFDGEEISRIVNDDRLSYYIKDISSVIFNLDLFESLENDLNDYIKYRSNTTDLSEDETKKIQHQLRNEELNNKKYQIQQEIKLLNELINKNQDKINDLKRDFETHGGLLKEKRDQLIHQKIELEQKRKQISDELNIFINDLFPIYLVKENLKQVKKQMEIEQQFETFNYISSTLKTDDLSSLVMVFKDFGGSITNEDQLKDHLLKRILQIFQPEEQHIVHRASFPQRSQIENVLKQLSSISTHEIINSYNKKKSLLNEIYLINKQIEKNDSTAEFKELLDQIESLNVEIEKDRQKLQENEMNYAEVEMEIVKNETEIKRLIEKIDSLDKTRNTFSLSAKIIDVSKQFRKVQLAKKFKEVELETTRMFNNLLRKEDFISKIVIDPVTFEIKLSSPTYEEISKDNLSAGEKQILLLSIIWAMITTSGRKLPFVFDTLLGRLDTNHKKSLLENLIPKFGDQVIILSTDSEIDNEHYKYVKPFIKRTYTIDFNKEEKRVFVEQNQFFHFHEKELSK